MKTELLIIIFSILSSTFYGQKGEKQITEFYSIKDAEHGYMYILPTNLGKELIEEKKDYKLEIYNSTDETFQINIFSEDYFDRNQKTEELIKYYEKIKAGEHIEIKESLILESKINIAENSFIIIGKNKDKEFIWKTIISIIPVTGRCGFNTMIFYYSNSKQNKRLGLELTKEFGNWK